MNSLAHYLEQYALLALEKQDKLAFLLEDLAYELDLEAGKVCFNDGHEFSFQVLGTESDNTFTWLWAWAEEQTEVVPENLLKAARQLREWGVHAGIREFTSPAVDLDRADGHVLSLIATELCRASCFFRDIYEGGAAFVLLFDKEIDAQPSFDLARLSRRFLELISRHEFDHRNALRSYCASKQLTCSEQGTTISCELGSGERLIAEFDEKGRLALWNEERVFAE
jgi:hypothetical protein